MNFFNKIRKMDVIKMTKLTLFTIAVAILTSCSSTPKEPVTQTIYNVREIAGTTVTQDVKDLLRRDESLTHVKYNRYVDPNNPDVMDLDGEFVRLDQKPEWITTPNNLNNLNSLNHNLMISDEALINEFKQDVIKEKKLISFLKNQNELLIQNIKSNNQTKEGVKSALAESAKLREECKVLSEILIKKIKKFEEEQQEKTNVVPKVETLNKETKSPRARTKIDYTNLNQD